MPESATQQFLEVQDIREGILLLKNSSIMNIYEAVKLSKTTNKIIKHNNQTMNHTITSPAVTVYVSDKQMRQYWKEFGILRRKVLNPATPALSTNNTFVNTRKHLSKDVATKDYSVTIGEDVSRRHFYRKPLISLTRDNEEYISLFMKRKLFQHRCWGMVLLNFLGKNSGFIYLHTLKSFVKPYLKYYKISCSLAVSRKVSLQS